MTTHRMHHEPLALTGHRAAEWYVLKLPEALRDVSVKELAGILPLPAKIADKLLRDDGIVKQRDRLNLRLFPYEEPEFVAEWTALNILYEDDFALVVNKPAGLGVHPDSRGGTGTLANQVAAYYLGTGQGCRVRHIHRLDKDTTGAVLYAKNEFAHAVFDQEMREKKIERIYAAVVEGIVAQDQGTIDRPIGRDRHHPKRRRVSRTGAHAVTHYEVIERYRDHTLLRLRLETGRTHQIRVHLSSLGHPLAGDTLYGGRQIRIARQALHGEQLLFTHPWTGERLTVTAPLPEDLKQLIADLKAMGSRT